MGPIPSDAEIDRARRQVARLLDRNGLLLMHDARFPSATACIAGEPVPGSWWGHRSGKLIFETLERIEDEGDVVWAKLVLGKETLVHRRLWPALVAAAGSRRGWQLRGLEPDAVRLLRRIRRGRPVRTDGAPAAGGRKPAVIATALERRLLAHGYSEHTPQGHHVRLVESWTAWAKRAGVRTRDLPAVDDALAALAAPVRAWLDGREPAGLLPWLPAR